MKYLPARAQDEEPYQEHSVQRHWIQMSRRGQVEKPVALQSKSKQRERAIQSATAAQSDDECGEEHVGMGVVERRRVAI